MLTFNPYRRIGVDEALDHKYFEGLHSKEDEPIAESQVDWKFDSFKPTKKLLQNYVYSECAKFHPEIINRDRQYLAWSGVDKVLREQGFSI
jgi:mitogen-activated protein kinase 1/3